MCDEKEKKCCEKPENLKGKPQDCTPEQIRKCHGEVRKHPCCEDETKAAAEEKQE